MRVDRRLSAILLTITGATIGLLCWPSYQSTMRLALLPPDGGFNKQIQHAIQTVQTRHYLLAIITSESLYVEELASQPMEDIMDTMRSALEFQVTSRSHASGKVRIFFHYKDVEAAHRVELRMLADLARGPMQVEGFNAKLPGAEEHLELNAGRLAQLLDASSNNWRDRVRAEQGPLFGELQLRCISSESGEGGRVLRNLHSAVSVAQASKIDLLEQIAETRTASLPAVSLGGFLGLVLGWLARRFAPQNDGKLTVRCSVELVD